MTTRLTQNMSKRSIKLLNTPCILRLKNNFSTLDNSTKRALVFPGQGAQYIGMAKDIYDEFAYVKQLIHECDEIVGYSLSDTMFSGDIKDLTQTIKAQPACLIHSLSLFKVLQTEYGLFTAYSNDFQAALGLSLGEYSALAASQCFTSETDAIFLVDKRARAMQECCINKDDSDDSDNEDLSQKMLAIMHDGSLTMDILEEVINQSVDLDSYVADIANHNSPRQVVISGQKFALDAVMTELKKQRIKCKYINTGGAFHSKLMIPAKNELKSVLENINVNLPINNKTVISNVGATIVNDINYSNGDIIKDLLCNQVCSPVSWYPSIMKCIQDFGVTQFVEIGPKATLSAMIRDICKINDIKDVQISNFDKLEDLKNIK